MTERASLTASRPMQSVRLLLAKHPDDSQPAVIGVIDGGIWEVISDQDEARYWSVAKSMFGDPEGYEYREAWAKLPMAELSAVYATPEIVGAVEADAE